MKRLLLVLLAVCAISSALVLDARERRVPIAAAGGGGASVTLQANGSSEGSSTAGTSASYTSLTVSSGTNLCVVAHLITGAAVTSPALQWDTGGTPQNFTLIRTQQMATWSKYIHTFGLVNPTTGNLTLGATWTGSANWMLQASVFENCDQTGGTTTFANATGGNGTSANPATTVTSATGHMVVSAMVSDGGTALSSQTGTAMFTASHSVGHLAHGQREDGAASVNTGFTLAGSTQWGINGFSIANAP